MYLNLITKDYKRLTNFVIYKNGFCTIGNIVLKQKFNYMATRNIYEELRRNNVDVQNRQIASSLFFIWRDPWERLNSFYRDLYFGNENHQQWLNTVGLNAEEAKDPEKFINAILQYRDDDLHTIVLWNLFKNNDINLYSDFDFWVDLRDLNDFIDENFNIKHFRINVTPKNDKILKALSPWEDEIKYLYRSDYSIAEAINFKKWMKTI